jgi:hypothetical protein
MQTIGVITIVFVLLAIVGVFALIAKDNERLGQNGSRRTASNTKEERAPGLE